MKLSTWRPLIKQYFDTLLDPTGWYVDKPPDHILRYATLPPIGNISFVLKPPFDVVATLSQELYYSERVTDEQWHSIPLEYYEGLYATVAYQILVDKDKLHPDIISVGFSEFDRLEEIPISTEQLADGWMITLRWSFKVKVLIAPEVDNTIIPITHLDLDVWTNRLSDNTFAEEFRTLDHHIALDINNP